jgi:hypothetical protein
MSTADGRTGSSSDVLLRFVPIPLEAENITLMVFAGPMCGSFTIAICGDVKMRHYDMGLNQQVTAVQIRIAIKNGYTALGKFFTKNIG